MKKYFIVTVDTEPEGQWDTQAAVTTENARYIQRFQQLCSRFGFWPVYLTDYAMLEDDFFVSQMKGILHRGECEIGMHLHAWDTPPVCEWDKKPGNRPYLIEYPDEIMEQKIDVITTRLREVFETDILSHRAGRWALDDRYIRYLDKYGYQVDCSVTPHVNWARAKGKGKDAKGSDYTHWKEGVQVLPGTNVLEVPVTVQKINRVTAVKSAEGSLKQSFKRLLAGDTYWFRPALFSQRQMDVLYERTKHKEYLEMMLHSSELMPNGSPYFPTQESIERLYEILEHLFELVSKTHEGITLKEFAKGYHYSQ